MKRLLILCSLSLLSLNAQAQQADNSVAERLQGCAELESGVARLDCYDALAVEVAAQRTNAGDTGRGRVEERAEQGRERAAEARERAEEARERAQQQREARQRERQEAAEAESRDDGKRYITIVERWQDPRGFWHFLTESGAEWEQTDADSRFPMDDDARYFIESGFFGSQSLSHDDTNRRLRIRRVN
jgi:multidrug efflux pump subunit AcrA (membrane-fusion protein)